MASPSAKLTPNISVPAAAFSSAVGAYAVLRAFSWQLRLSPFSLQVGFLLTCA
jgi:hypothetical protein